MAKLGTAWVNIRANLKPLKAGLAMARAAVKKSMVIIGSVVRKAMRIVKRVMQALTATIIASVWAFVRFEKQMANVATMLDKHTMDYMPKYGEELKRLAVTFGESTATLSTGLYNILSASIAPAKAIDVLTVAIKAAKAGMTDTTTAASAILTVLNSYGMSVDNAARVSDILFAVVKRGVVTFNELAPTIGKVASIAALAGLSFEELGAAIATITRAGLNAFQTTTSLRALLLAFIKPQKDAAEVAKKFGFELNSSTIKAIGLTGVLKKLKGATAEELAQLMPTSRGLTGFAAALKQAEKNAADLELMLNPLGLTQAALDKMTNTLAFSLSQLKQSFVILGVTIGGPFNKAMKLAIGYVKVLILKFQEFYKDNSEQVEAWAVKVIQKLILVSEGIQAWAVNSKSKIMDWIATVRTAFAEAVAWFTDLLSIIKDKGWGEGLKKLGIDMEKALMIAVEKISPKAVTIGTLIAHGFIKGMLGAVGIGQTLAAGTVVGAQSAYMPKGALTVPTKDTGLVSALLNTGNILWENIKVVKELRDSNKRLVDIQERAVSSDSVGGIK